MELKNTLWTKNFTIITLGTVVSAIGSVSMNFAGSLLVYDQSQSTFMAGLFSALSMLPQVIIPLVAAPWVDRTKRKPLIVGLDAVCGILYVFLAVYLWKIGFDYLLYLLFSLVVSCVGAVYQLAYESLYPKLIPEGFSQKGYTVSGMIYPTVILVMTPVAAILYKQFGIVSLCAMQGILLLVASAVESQIRVQETTRTATENALRQYVQDVKAAFDYLKKEKGLQRIYAYMPVTNGIGNANTLLIMAWFQSPVGLGVELYSLFTAAEFIGRTIGGAVHYKISIPAEKRFGISYLVYQFYSVMDSVLLVLPYPLMLVNRAICGFLGINSATLRSSAVQNYVPDEMRAKLNALFNVCMSLSIIVCKLGMGAMGEWLPIPVCVAVMSVVNILVCWYFIGRGKQDIDPIYHSYQK